ncbi:MAG TPA: hypothetical protein DCQ30_10785 [Acidimicrobiaceae bacterium]|nr:hypothetical protein [Acidimicrobiaceae bacterium]
MAVFLFRVALADRPGALGAVASRIGAVRADVVGVEIVERAGGRAVDEFVVELADQAHMALLVSEIEQVDGAAVEQVRPLPRGRRDARRDAYEDARTLLTERSRQRLLSTVAELGRRELDAAWAAVVGATGTGEGHAVAGDGRPPAARWLIAYLDETRTAHGRPPSPEIAWAELASWDLVLVVGRPGCPFARGEQLRLEGLAGLADARWADLAHSGTRTALVGGVDRREVAGRL